MKNPLRISRKFLGSQLILPFSFLLLIAVLSQIQSRYFQELSTVQYDDSYITYRYAANLVNGHGLVFNVGEMVATNSASSLLWTLLLFLVGLFKISLMPTFAVWFSMCFHVITTLLLMGRLDLNSKVSVIRLSLGILFFLNPWLLYWVFSGMETSLFLMVVALFLRVCYQIQDFSNRRIYRFGLIPVLIVLGIITRWEAASIVFAGLLIVFLQTVLKNRKVFSIYLFYLLLSAVTMISLIVFYKLYYLTIIPNPVTFKNLVQYYNLTFFEAGNEVVNFLTSSESRTLTLSFTLLLAVIIYSFSRIREKILIHFLLSPMLPLWFAFSVAIGFLILSAHSDFYRYPLLTLVFITLIPGLALSGRFSDKKRSKIIDNVVASGIAIMVLIEILSFKTTLSNVSQATGQYHYLQAARIESGKYLEANSKPGTRILSSDIGAISFYNLSNTYIDASGLTNHQLLGDLLNGDGYKKRVVDNNIEFLVDTTDLQGETGSEYIFNNLSKYYSGEFPNEIACKFTEVYNKTLERRFPSTPPKDKTFVSLFRLDRKNPSITCGP
jgi:hypothetical protein